MCVGLSKYQDVDYNLYGITLIGVKNTVELRLHCMIVLVDE